VGSDDAQENGREQRVGGDVVPVREGGDHHGDDNVRFHAAPL